jgi:hypothetical protein
MIWTTLNNGTLEGDNQLVQLAMRIHSVVANSADCERLFSQMGNIHTKGRNKLNYKRVRDMAVVKMYLNRRFNVGKPERKKRKFDEMATASSLPEPPSKPSSTGQPAEAEEEEKAHLETDEMLVRLTSAAADDDNLDEDDTLDDDPPDAALLQKLNASSKPTAIPRPRYRGSVRLYFNTEKVTKLPNLWDFRKKNLNSWTGMWNEGEGGLAVEALLDGAESATSGFSNGDNGSSQDNSIIVN